MKTSWTDIALIERYLERQLSPAEANGFTIRMEVDPAFSHDVALHKNVRALVARHHYSRLKQQAAVLHKKLYNAPARTNLRQAIEALFKY
jgi:hypothetical protein